MLELLYRTGTLNKLFLSRIVRPPDVSPSVIETHTLTKQYCRIRDPTSMSREDEPLLQTSSRAFHHPLLSCSVLSRDLPLQVFDAVFEPLEPLHGCRERYRSETASWRQWRGKRSCLHHPLRTGYAGRVIGELGRPDAFVAFDGLDPRSDRLCRRDSFANDERLSPSQPFAKLEDATGALFFTAFFHSALLSPLSPS